jgi:hypothetical protein
MDGNPKNGREEYLYGQEPDCNQNSPAAQYAKVNLETCQDQEILGVAPEDPNGWKGYAEGSVNALIQFRGEYLVINVENFDEAGVSIEALAYSKRAKGFKSPSQCAWHSVK